MDIYGHMNNARYLAILDLGRLDLLLQSRKLGIFLKRRWYPVVAAETIRFRESLKLFQRFEVETTPLGRDERTLFVQQKVRRRGKLVAEATIRLSIQSWGTGTVSPVELIEALGTEPSQAVLPAWVVSWITIPTANNGYATPIPVGLKSAEACKSASTSPIQ
jgi:acyl-CoA thioesterase FadM